MSLILDGTAGIANNATDLSYTGTLTGSTGVVNIGSGQVYKDASGNVGIGTTVNNVFDQIASARPLVVQRSDTSTTLNGSTASIAIVNGDTTTNNSAQLNFAAITGGSTNQYSGAAISCIFGARTNTVYPSGVLAFSTSIATQAPVERMRLDSSGNLLVGITSDTGAIGAKLIVAGGSTEGSCQVGFGGVNGTSFRIFHANSGGSSAALTIAKIEKVSSSGRSINAAGTVNASGADYAEYMTKAGDFTVAKGDVVGIDDSGKLTNVFANAVSFCVKSTTPSYVGGDTWGAELEGAELEAARQTVDRIAFAGQVPVNVIGATAGQYIIPINDSGAIKGQAVTSPNFEQYQQAVGKVIAIEADGCARIIVKVA